MSLGDMLYNKRLVRADIFPRKQLNHSQPLIEKPLYKGHFYRGQLL